MLPSSERGGNRGFGLCSQTMNVTADKLKYIYIVSPRYSGSTLLSFLFATHPEVSTIGERKKFYVKSLKPDQDESRCSCGQDFVECQHWNRIKQRVLKRVSAPQLTTNVTDFVVHRNKYVNYLTHRMVTWVVINELPRFLLPFRSKVGELCLVNRIIVEEALRIDDNRMFLDSSKPIQHAIYLSLIADFDLYVINLTRDPRAQISSALNYNDWSVERATQYWSREMRQNRRILKKWHVKQLKVRYEDLCQDPGWQMNNIFEFVGLDPTKSSLDFRAQPRHIMGNGSMRLGSTAEIEERKDWLLRLKKDEIEHIERNTAGFRDLYSVQ